MDLGKTGVYTPERSAKHWYSDYNNQREKASHISRLHSNSLNQSKIED